MTILEQGFYISTVGLGPDAIARIRAAVLAETAQSVWLGWTEEAAAEFMRRLRARGADELVSTVEATTRRPVLREEVYEIAGYDSERSLRGFTRPLKTVCDGLKADRMIPEDAPVPVFPVYDPNIRGYQRAREFRMVSELVPVFVKVI